MDLARQRPSPPATEADLLALPDEGRGFELFEGALIEKQAGFRHGQAQVGQVVRRLKRRVD